MGELQTEDLKIAVRFRSSLFQFFFLILKILIFIKNYIKIIFFFGKLFLY